MQSGRFASRVFLVNSLIVLGLMRYGLVPGLISSADAAVLSPVEPSPAQPRPYTRIAHPDTNTIQLQIAMRRFRAKSDSAPEIWLVAVSHIGETNYYQALQAFLDAQGLVLYEGVGHPQAHPPVPTPSDAAFSPPAEEQQPEMASLQSTLADSLGLAFQLDTIQYRRLHFKNSDLSLEQLQSLFLRQTRGSSNSPSSDSSNPAFRALLQTMDGSSWSGILLHMGVKLLGSSPKLRAMTRLVLIQVLGQLKGDLTQIQGLPPDWKELILVLIRERNKAVLRDLKSALGESTPPHSIAILYGAGHMDDLEKRLASDLNYHPEQDKWLPAITVQPAASGLTKAEIATIHNLIRWQMKALKEQRSEPEP